MRWLSSAALKTAAVTGACARVTIQADSSWAAAPQRQSPGWRVQVLPLRESPPASPPPPSGSALHSWATLRYQSTWRPLLRAQSPEPVAVLLSPAPLAPAASLQLPQRVGGVAVVGGWVEVVVGGGGGAMMSYTFGVAAFLRFCGLSSMAASARHRCPPPVDPEALPSAAPRVVGSAVSRRRAYAFLEFWQFCHGGGYTATEAAMRRPPCGRLCGGERPLTFKT